MADMVKQLRKAIKADGRNLYRLSQDSGVSYPQVHRFANGVRDDLMFSTAAKLLTTLGYKLTKGKVR